MITVHNPIKLIYLKKKFKRKNFCIYFSLLYRNNYKKIIYIKQIINYLNFLKNVLTQAEYKYLM